MASIGGPNIVKDGLILHLDAANPKSYPGSGNTIYNLADSENFPSMYLYGDVSYGNISNGVVSLSGLGNNTSFGCFLRGLGNLASTVNNSFTSEGWIKRSSNTDCEIFSYRETHVRLSFCIEDSNIVFYQREDFSPYTVRYTSVSVINNLNKWDYYSLVKNGSSFKFYKNGILIGETIFSISENIVSSGAYHTGIAWSDDDYMSNGVNGYIGPLRHYTRPLSDSEILQNFNATKSRFL